MISARGCARSPIQAPGEVRVDERPEPALVDRGDAIVAIEASGICGSDLHIYHGRVKIEPGFTIGHEFVGTVLATGEDVTRVVPGDRVLGCYHTACGRCFFCLRGIYHKCDAMRTFGHGALLGALPGTQAEQALVPTADMTLRKVPAELSADVALFAGDVMGTGLPRGSGGRRAPGQQRRRPRSRPGRALRRSGGHRGGRRPGAGHRFRARAAEGGQGVRSRAGASDRGQPA